MFENKCVVITGGSEGIGFACAACFLERGARVLITGRSKEKLHHAETLLHSDRVHTLVWDVTDFANLDARVDDCVRILGKIDIFINNAGLAAKADFMGDVFGVTYDDWDTVMNTNLKSMYFICRRVILVMKSTGNGGCIINIGSEQGFRPGGFTPYPISKCAVDYLTKGFGRRFIKDGIRVNSVAPGAVNTSLQQNDGILPAKAIAATVCFLASEEAYAVSGETLIADRCEPLKRRCPKRSFQAIREMILRFAVQKQKESPGRLLSARRFFLASLRTFSCRFHLSEKTGSFTDIA